MAKTKELSVEHRAEIVTKFKAGTSASKLAELYKISRKTVYNLVKKKDTLGNLENKKRTGRKVALNPRDCRHIIGVVLSNPTISPVKIAAASKNLIGKHISDSTLRRRMTSIDINTYVVRAVVDITPRNKEKRLAFALEYKEKPLEFWFDVLWTDEVAFQFQGSFSKQFMHLPKQLKGNAVQPINRFGGGTVMLWIWRHGTDRGYTKSNRIPPYLK